MSVSSLRHNFWLPRKISASFSGVVVVYSLPLPLFVGGVRSSHFATSQLISPFGQQLHHSSRVSALMICRGLSACTEMLWMCVLYVSFWCVAMGSALLFILRSRLLVYSAWSGVNRVQVVLFGFSMRWFCFVHAKTLCRYGCIYLLVVLVLVCVDVMVMSYA